MAANIQKKHDLRKAIESSIMDALPKPAGHDHVGYVQVWQQRLNCLGRMYRQTSRFCDWLFRSSDQPLDLRAELEFSPPDVLRAEVLQDSNVDALRQAVEQATTAQCTTLATLIGDRVCNLLVDKGQVGIMQAFDNNVARLTVPDGNGARYIYDVVGLRENSTLSVVGGWRNVRLLCGVPSWLRQRITSHTGQCVRVVDDAQRNLGMPPSPVSLTTLGPFILSARVPRPRSAKSKPMVVPRGINSQKLVGGILALAGLGLVAFGISSESLLHTAGGGLGFLCSLYLSLRS